MNDTNLFLRRMSQEEFENYIESAIPIYAGEHAKAKGTTIEDELEQAREAYESLLPEGLETKGNHLNTVMFGDEPIGLLWFAEKETGSLRSAYIYEIEIFEKFRGQGHSKEVMKLLEKEAKQLGLVKIGLHVFGHNTVARNLYEKMGYQVTNLVMAKEL